MGVRNWIVGAVSLLVLLPAALAAEPEEVTTEAVVMRFGISVNGISTLTNAGVKPDYSVVWAGIWNKDSWGGVDSKLRTMRDAGVTPIVLWYYWGDSISKSCVQNGCDGRTKSGWYSMSRELASHIRDIMGSRGAIVIVEPEFNKNDITTWETFDGYLVEVGNIFQKASPDIKTAIGFGNWGRDRWKNFDRAVAASDYTAFQTLRSSVRHTKTQYLDTVDSLAEASSYLYNTFRKPTLLFDLGLSSYPEMEWAYHQERVIKELFSRLGELESKGLRAIVYRTLKDDPNKPLHNHHKVAERWFGLAHADGSKKPSYDDWVNGIKRERSGGGSEPPPPPPPPPGDGTFTATFTPKGNEWWVETKVSASKSISGVDARINGGSWTSLPKTSWGSWAKGLHAPSGSKVEFRARSSDGAHAYSTAYAWPPGSSSKGDGGTFDVSFSPKGNEWWIEVRLSGSTASVGSVSARIDGGAWFGLSATDWGTWAAQHRAREGSDVQFRATDSSGKHDYSAVYPWPP